MVEVYRNLNKRGPQGEPVYSVRVKGKVREHLSEVTLSQVTFKVSEAGRQRVLREKRKNVHATAQGIEGGEPSGVPVRVSYNPYKGGTFYRVDNGHAVKCARFFRVDPTGVYAWL
jgi:predicted extracellular nuclease